MRYRMAILAVAFILLPRHTGGPTDPVARSAFVAEDGLASFYGRAFHGRRTASGIRFDMNAMHAAHPMLPFGTVIRVTNRDNGRFVDVTVVDRGPAPRMRAQGVIVDLSHAAARALDLLRVGKAPVRVNVVSIAPSKDGLGD